MEQTMKPYAAAWLDILFSKIDRDALCEKITAPLLFAGIGRLEDDFFLEYSVVSFLVFPSGKILKSEFAAYWKAEMPLSNERLSIVSEIDSQNFELIEKINSLIQSGKVRNLTKEMLRESIEEEIKEAHDLYGKREKTAPQINASPNMVISSTPLYPFEPFVAFNTPPEKM